jgi:hypothetical protein
MMDITLKCGSCQREITNKTEVEYSEHLSEFYCNPDCATDRYFDYLQSEPFHFEAHEMESKGVRLNGDRLESIDE